MWYICHVFTDNPSYSRIIPTKEAPLADEKAPKPRAPLPCSQGSEILDVHMTAELLTVSIDTVYDLFKKGDLPARKVGRKWLTTRTAVLRWIDHSSEQDTMARAIANGDREALAAALKAGTVQVKKGR
jgi:excisionase family DNA binding protein